MQYLLTTPFVASIFLAATVNGRWELGIGDPTPMGWITTLSYFLVACAGFYGVWHTLRTPHPRLGKRAVIFWLCCGLLMLLLAVNKQLDLQTYLTQLGRDWSKTNGWYGARRELQTWFIWALVGLGGAGLFALACFIRGARPAYYLALVGVLFTGCFVIIRASSFHHVDTMLGYQVAGIQMNWILELGGIFIVGVSTLTALALQPYDGPSEPDSTLNSEPEPAPEPEAEPDPEPEPEPEPKKEVHPTPVDDPVDKSETPVACDGPDFTDEEEEGEEDDGDDLPEIIILDS